MGLAWAGRGRRRRPRPGSCARWDSTGPRGPPAGLRAPSPAAPPAAPPPRKADCQPAPHQTRHLARAALPPAPAPAAAQETGCGIWPARPGRHQHPRSAPAAPANGGLTGRGHNPHPGQPAPAGSPPHRPPYPRASRATALHDAPWQNSGQNQTHPQTSHLPPAGEP